MVRGIVARIAWIEDEDASGEIADLYRELKKTSTRGNVRTRASRLHFTDGRLAELSTK